MDDMIDIDDDDIESNGLNSSAEFGTIMVRYSERRQL
jgi:hypothetical protein